METIIDHITGRSVLVADHDGEATPAPHEDTIVETPGVPVDGAGEA